MIFILNKKKTIQGLAARSKLMMKHIEKEKRGKNHCLR